MTVRLTQWRSQLKMLGGKFFDFRETIVFCLRHRFSKQKMTAKKRKKNAPGSAYDLTGFSPSILLNERWTSAIAEVMIADATDFRVRLDFNNK